MESSDDKDVQTIGEAHLNQGYALFWLNLYYLYGGGIITLIFLYYNP